MLTTVVNKRNTDKYDVYIGRPSKWGNPYTHKAGVKNAEVVASRQEAVLKYKEYILSNKELMADLHELKGKVLACWCAPELCHGHVLAQLANEL